MPKLTVPERTYGKAIGSLINLYKKEPGFIEELRGIRGVYEPEVINWLDSSVPQWRILRSEVKKKRDQANDAGTLSDEEAELLKQFSHSIRRFYGGWNVSGILLDYEKELRNLADRWKLKTNWSGLTLIISHINDIIGINPERAEPSIEIPVEVIEPMLDKPPLPPLKYEVTSYELMYGDQGEIIREFTKRLSDYAKSLKSSGWKELPSATERHVFWWFEHYVHGKLYPEIAGECSPVVDAEGIKRAVSDFRKLLGIKIK